MVNFQYKNTNNRTITDTFIIISFYSVRTLLKRMKSNACVFNISRPLVGVFLQADNFSNSSFFVSLPYPDFNHMNWTQMGCFINNQ